MHSNFSFMHHLWNEYFFYEMLTNESLEKVKRSILSTISISLKTSDFNMNSSVNFIGIVRKY